MVNNVVTLPYYDSFSNRIYYIRGGKVYYVPASWGTLSYHTKYMQATKKEYPYRPKVSEVSMQIYGVNSSVQPVPTIMADYIQMNSYREVFDREKTENVVNAAL